MAFSIIITQLVYLMVVESIKLVVDLFGYLITCLKLIILPTPCVLEDHLKVIFLKFSIFG